MGEREDFSHPLFYVSLSITTAPAKILTIFAGGKLIILICGVYYPTTKKSIGMSDSSARHPKMLLQNS